MEKKLVFLSYIGMTKIGQESPVKEHSCGFFYLIFQDLGDLECYTSLCACVFWGFNRE